MKVYVSKESKKEETKSTAYSFLLVSILGFIALILFATGVLPIHVADYMKIMLCVVMGVMFLIFFVFPYAS
jgi:heme/copper-type cytochrome/quinol oxidase subunit 4